ncbi:flagellar filament capping protein FliD [Candidatus Sumerlaeota bacterium]|nr:flagellar filament capping protein FliD [Candidatus Sumerlaeota bacterium]
MTISTGVGLISGIDYDSLISQMSEISRKQVTLVQQRQATYQVKNQAYGALVTQLSALRDQVEAMRAPSDFLFRQASSTNQSAIGVSAENTAAIGSYSVEVLQLAKADRIGSQGVGSLDSAIASGSGSLTLQVGSGQARSYAVTATTTLTQLRDMINADTSSDVTASIVNDGSSTSPYRLVLSAKVTGEQNSIEIVQNDTTLNLENKVIGAASASSGNAFDGTVASSGTYTGSGSFNVVMRITGAGAVGAAKFVVSLDGGRTFGSTEYTTGTAAQDISGGLGVEAAFQAGTTDFAVGDTFSIQVFDPRISTASDAIVSVDGIEVRRETNTFTDVIDGVTLTAKEVTTSAATVSVANQLGLLNAEVITFQSTYNSLVEQIRQLTAYDTETKVAQPLFADSAARSLRSDLARLITSPVAGLNSEYSTLASIGLRLQADGSLSVDQAKLNEVMEDDPDAIMRLFGRSGASDNTAVQFVNSSTATTAQNFQVNIATAAARALVQGAQALDPGGLVQDEALTFTVDDNTFVVQLTAGDTIDTVVSKINSRFATEGVGLRANSEAGVLNLQTTAYGSQASFSVVSDRPGGNPNQLGIGTTQIDASGVDVAGTIDGVAATGEGQTLRGGTGTTAEGLELLVTAAAPTTANVRVTSGVANQMFDLIGKYTDSESGAITTRQEGLTESISDLNDRIDKIEARIERDAERMRNQFIAMEKQLAQYQGLGDMVANSISQLQKAMGLG